MIKQIYIHDHSGPDYELILKLKNGNYDWIDPIQSVLTNEGILFVDNGRHVYEYILKDIEDFNIREYSSEDIFEYQGGNL